MAMLSEHRFFDRYRMRAIKPIFHSFLFAQLRKGQKGGKFALNEKIKVGELC
jgi:hypothetical protein